VDGLALLSEPHSVRPLARGTVGRRGRSRSRFTAWASASVISIPARGWAITSPRCGTSAGERVATRRRFDIFLDLGRERSLPSAVSESSRATGHPLRTLAGRARIWAATARRARRRSLQQPFDDVLEGYQPSTPPNSSMTIRHVNASRLHAHQKVGGAHGRGTRGCRASGEEERGRPNLGRGFACSHQFENVLEMATPTGHRGFHGDGRQNVRSRANALTSASNEARFPLR